MRVGLSSASFYPDIYTEDSIKKIKSLGFNCGEVFLNSPSEYEEDFVKNLKDEKVKHNFDVISVHSFSSSFEPFLFDKYERRRRDLMKYFSMVCRAAAILGARYYTFHGLRLVDYKFLNTDFIMEVYNDLAYIACEHGIELSQENVSWCMSNDVNFLRLLREECKYPICFTLDIKQAYKAEVDTKDYIKVMGEQLKNIHINDRDNEKVCLLPGKGNVNYKGLLQELDHINYKGDCIIEVYRENFNSDEELVKAKTYLEELINF